MKNLSIKGAEWDNWFLLEYSFQEAQCLYQNWFIPNLVKIGLLTFPIN